jgi:hypothetical protein
MMFDFARRLFRSSGKRRGKTSDWRLEALEDRVVLSETTTLALARTQVMATSRTALSSTETILQASNTTAEVGQVVFFVASVTNANTGKPVSSGRVEFFQEAPRLRLLGKVNLNKKGMAGITTTKLTQLGTNVVVADFIPANLRAAGSESQAASVQVIPLSVGSFRVVPARPFGHTGEPSTFTVTALSPQGQPVTDYTGTVMVTSPTDSNTIFSAHVYVALHLKPPPPVTMGLATFQPQIYTFTTADHGTHTFLDGVTFNKGGAEVLKVQQQNNSRVRGFATFAIS